MWLSNTNACDKPAEREECKAPRQVYRLPISCERYLDLESSTRVKTALIDGNEAEYNHGDEHHDGLCHISP